MGSRRFNANPPHGINRCTATVILRDKSSAVCMRRAVHRSGFCLQHLRMSYEKTPANSRPSDPHGRHPQ